jgi:polar amino acid transport system substrate-binding protein
VLLPNLAKAKGASLIAVAASTGVSATHAARKFGARYATTDYYRVLDDRDVNLVIIATRHNLHARMAIEALERGKDVFVEKPLAMTVDELRNVAQAARAASGRLTVGFNRRYAPLVQALRAKLWGRTEPLLMTFRVNAGPLPAESWVRDPSEGGGRVLGEVCHFVDLLSYLSGSSPIRLTAMDLNGVSDPAHDDNLAVTLAFADGSTGTVVYSSSGAPSMAKERLEAFCDGRSYVIDNFRTLETYVGHRRSTVRRAQDKGHAALLSAACQATTGGEAPMPLDSLLATSLATLLIRPAIEQRTWVTVDPEKELGLPPAKA